MNTTTTHALDAADRIATQRRGSASSVSATSACRWRSNSRAPGFDVTGFDVDACEDRADQRRQELHPRRRRGGPRRCVQAGKLTRDRPTCAGSAAMDAIDICVPTPLRKTKDPDLSYVVKAVEAVAATLKRGQLVILESTTYPGTTDEVVQPMLEANGLQGGRRFLPRVLARARRSGQPAVHTRKNIPKIVGGVGPASTEAACALYGDERRRAWCRSARRASPRW